mgnify:CR=1 FL=1
MRRRKTERTVRGLRRMLCATAVLGLAVSCENPFFPPTDDPVGNKGLKRSTPRGVVEQLIRAYETMQFELFKDVFAPDSVDREFRFYVAPSFALEKLGRGEKLSSEDIRQDEFAFVDPGTYHYWNLDGELARHERLFSQVSDIRFTARPVDDSIVYTVSTTVETLGTGVGSGDTIYYIWEKRDTTRVEILVEESRMSIDHTSWSRPMEFELGPQVFCLSRDPSEPELWVIHRWFDLGGE